MERLELDDKGVWRVSTETSAYILDLDNGWGQRLPGEGLGVGPEHEGEIVAVMPLYVDGGKFRLYGLDCVLGERMFIMTSGSGAWVHSTFVRKIERLEE